MSDKKRKLEKIKNEMEKDNSLPLQQSNLVFGEGDPDAEVMFIGEAPGYNEDKQRRPFVGRAGKLLTKLINEIGWSREDVYITNIVKRRPPSNRDPKNSEIEAYKPYLTEQIQIIDPKVIVPLGRFSMEYFLSGKKISKVTGQVFWMKEKIVMPIFHPAAALRSTSTLETTKENFHKLRKVVENYDELLEQKGESEDGVEEENDEDRGEQTLF